MNIHPFEQAGLGQAPFRFGGLNKNVYSAAPGHSQPGGTCDYCGQGILWECVIVSREGKFFTVGQDCVRKLARIDNKLAADSDRARLKRAREDRERARQEAHEARVREHEAKLQQQRDLNGGLTDHEVEENRLEVERKAAAEHWAIENQWIIQILMLQRSTPFIESMIDKLHQGSLNSLSDRCITILEDLYAKHHGRRNSKASNKAVETFNLRRENA